VLVSRMVEALRRRDPVFRIETGRHGLRLKDLYPFAAILFGRTWVATRCRISPLGRRRFAIL
jgi:hypothetical protein